MVWHGIVSHTKLLQNETKWESGSMSRAAVFLDRDGVLVEQIYYPETGEIEASLRPEDVRLLPGAEAK